ncbi:ThiF protein [Pycnococcus provasolii]|uniref:ThiF protein n=1 Tax=Pycnococcus provasolii TaxID=41880 RepID=A0A830HIU5_9CHLO|nr:ThiF protein [Pycnococcus provasolii]
MAMVTDSNQPPSNMNTNTNTSVEVMRFEPFASAVDVAFWMQINAKKLDVWRLDETPYPLKASYAPCARAGEIAAPLQVAEGALESSERAGTALAVHVNGTVRALNQKESLRDAAVKETALANAAATIANAIASGEAMRNPALLAQVALLAHADHKSYVFSYRFAFPALQPASPAKVAAPNGTPSAAACDACQAYVDGVRSQTGSLPAAWIVHGDDKCLSVADAATELGACFAQGTTATMLAYVDHARDANHPGWVLRNLLALVARTEALHGGGGAEGRVTVPCLSIRFRNGAVDQAACRIIFADVAVEAADAPAACASSCWELNSRGVAAPRTAKLASAFDPHALADQAVELNLKLMRWRANPKLDVDAMRHQKCLLVGAGTLGCAVARTLLGWGVKHITLVDNGTVSYSNPARQCLYEFADASAEGGPRPKAVAAAESLRRIHPSCVANGEVLNIPCPGHPIPPSDVASAEEAYSRLSALVESHDAVFLLTDSRESRWLPTILCARHGKPCINAALGYDTFLVMRHGYGQGKRLGCYFCNDVVAPADSTTNRSMDMMCTVARPGLSFMASALAVELLAACTQHPLGAAAPAMTTQSSDADDDAVLGPVPHALRGSLHGFTLGHWPAEAFPRCVGCAPTVISALEERGFALVREACEQPKLLEEISGLVELLEGGEEWDIDDDEEEGDDNDDF